MTEFAELLRGLEYEDLQWLLEEAKTTQAYCKQTYYRDDDTVPNWVEEFYRYVALNLDVDEDE